MFKGIDLFSDTATRPDLAMKNAMMQALVADEQQNEDPTTKKLEEVMAHKLGKSSAMFFPSATMANQVAVKLNTEPGDEVIGSEFSHVFNSEGGGMAFHSLVQPKIIRSNDGLFSGNDVRAQIRKIGPHYPKSSLVVVENTCNASGGVFWPLELLKDVTKTSKELELKSHLDGARIFNAVVASGHDLKTLCQDFDTVTVCFSKGMGCPMGAVLGFDEKHWVKVRRFKQIFGGALRQSGIVAAACLHSLEHSIPHLKIDHLNAQELALGLSDINFIEVENKNPSSNMVFFKLKDEVKTPDFLNFCKNNGVRFSLFEKNRFRAVTHKDVSCDDITKAINIVSKFQA